MNFKLKVHIILLVLTLLLFITSCQNETYPDVTPTLESTKTLTVTPTGTVSSTPTGTISSTPIKTISSTPNKTITPSESISYSPSITTNKTPTKTPQPTATVAKNPILIPLSNKSGGTGHTATEIQAGESIGLQFNAQVSFDYIEVSCPSWSNNIGNLTFNLFKWDKDYNKTTNGTPIATKTFVNYNDNQTLRLSFPAVSKGEYLFTITDSVEKVGVWTYSNTLNNTRFYKSGSEIQGSFDGSIHFLDKTSTYFGSISSSFDSTFITPPPASTIKPDSPIIKMNVKPDTWAAIDGLGRTLPDYSEVGDKKDKFVGLFFWTWHVNFASFTTPRNVTQIIAKYPDAQNNFNHPAWEGTAIGTPYFWDEPLYGYYNIIDEYVLRKQAELIADAGVDVIIFDCTNGDFTWRGGYTQLLKTFSKARNDGVKTPQIAFMFNFGAMNETVRMLRSIYLDIYRNGSYQDLWFYWEGKPLIMAHNGKLNSNDQIEKEILNFFTFRKNEPTYFASNTSYQQKYWGWCSVYPQTKFGIRSNGTVEQMTVNVAQNATDTKLTAMNDPNGIVHGRSYAKGNYSYSYTYKGNTITVNKNINNSKRYGLNFQQQWDYAINVNPDFIFVTGWNEWIAGRHDVWMGVQNAFPDQFTDEYSRDIEPSKGDLKDYYYYQLVANIRRYKGVARPDTSQAFKSIDIKSQNDQWSSIKPEYAHYIGSTMKRNTTGYVGTHYTNNGLRNDIVKAKVAYDNKYVFFMVETKDILSPYSDKAWMRLLIDTIDDKEKDGNGWEGFEYILNKQNPDQSFAKLERFKGSWQTETVGTVEYSIKNNRLQVKIPLTYLGFTENTKPTFNFKWSDNMVEDGNILDFYLNGDVAPGGRFCFSFK